MGRPGTEAVFNGSLLLVAVVAIVYHLLSAHFLLLSADKHMNLHLSLALLLTFLFFLKKSKHWQPYIILVLASLGSTIWVHYNMDYLKVYSGFPQQPYHVLVIAVILMLLILEGIRRSFGYSLVIVILVFILYPFFGRYLPGILHAPPLKPTTILFRESIGSMGTGGIYGTLLSISANAIFLFIVYAGILKATGATRFVMQIGKVVGRRLAGGIGLTAVVSSALIGTITGSVAGNIAATGSFTIPLMKKAGYKNYQAAAIEAMASTGGQIMPPVMGFVAFLMIALTGIPYIELCLMVAIPAILYFLSGALYVQFQAAKMGLGAKAKVEKIDMDELITFAPVFILPLVVLAILLAKDKPLGYSMSLTIITLIVIALINKPVRSHFLANWTNGAIDGAVMGAQVALICAGMSMLIETMGMIALLLKIPSLVLDLSHGVLLIALLLTMVASIILGSGVSATAAYVLVAAVVGPALVKMGLDEIQAHLFAFWFACIGFLTPPIAVGAAVASRVANSLFWPTAIEATKVALGAFLIPFLMIWCPSLILRPTDPIWAILGPLAGVALIVALQVMICNYYVTSIGRMERIFYFALSCLLFFSMAFHALLLTMLALIFFISGTTFQILKIKKRRAFSPI